MTRRQSALFVASVCVALVMSYALWLILLVPEKAALWGFAAGSVAAMWLTAEAHARMRGRDPASARTAVAGAAILIALALAVTGADAIGLVRDPDHVLGARLNGIAVGLVLAGYANYVPKRLVRYEAESPAPARRQALLRFAGRALTIAGIAHALVWLTAPSDRMALWSTVPVAAALVLIAARMLIGSRSPQR